MQQSAIKEEIQMEQTFNKVNDVVRKHIEKWCTECFDEFLQLKEDASVGWCADEVLKLEQVASVGRFLVVSH